MALAPFLVQRPYTKSVDGVTALAVMALDAAQAKQVANGYSPKDRPGAWDNATVTAITATLTDWIGWTFHVIVRDNVTGARVVDVEVVGTATDNTIDEVGALLVTALNATTPIAGAAYTANTLKIAETTDGLGDNIVTFEVRSPNGDVVPGLIGTIVDEGASGAVLSAVMPADADVVPAVVGVAGAF